MQVLYGNIADIFFVDSLYGWASHNNGGVHRTTDSGFNWIADDRDSGGCICGVYFINRDTGWAVGSCGKIWKSIDGGENWIIQNYLWCEARYSTVHFFDENTGFVAGYKNTNGFIIKTSDGGNTWTQAYISPVYQYAREFVDQYWFNRDTGWFCGYNVLVKTTDGGASFIDYYPNIPPTQNGSNALLTIHFADHWTGWVGGGNLDRTNIYKTSNGGVNWIFQNNPMAQYEFSAVGDVIFLSPDTGWASVYYLRTIMFTSNGGSNWVIDTISSAEFGRFALYNRSKVWCASGTNGQLWYANLGQPIGIVNIGHAVPENFALYQNYPNPFNLLTRLRFDITKPGPIRIAIYDVAGKEIDVLVNQELRPGSYEVSWNAGKLNGVSSGIYFYSLESEDVFITKKLVLIK